jgi:hypothetical protein
MPGPLIMVFVLLVFIPISVCITGAIVAAILGWSLKDDAEDRNEGSELLEIS